MHEEGTWGQLGPQPTCPILCPQVILGGGRKYMFPRGAPDPEYPSDASQNGIRLDGKYLVQEWLTKHQVTGAGRCGRHGRGRASVWASGLWAEAWLYPCRVPGMCGTALSSCRHPWTSL